MHILTHTPILTIFYPSYYHPPPIHSPPITSLPPSHCRNKNASTAGTQMGFSVLPRPYALVLGSHEDDVSMTEGVVGLKEQISIGFIELSEDIAQRLPVSIDTAAANVVYIYPFINICTHPSIIHLYTHPSIYPS